jgi:hypothetical protein
MEGLSREEARVLVYVTARVPVSARARCWRCEVTPGAPPALVASAPLTASPGAALVFTLGAVSGRIVATLTDGDAVKVGALLAHAEHAAPAGDTIRVLPLDDPYLAANGRAGLALVPPSRGRWFRDLPDAIRFDADVRQVSMATFLSPRELREAQADGAAGLVAAFERGERDLVRVASRERAGA